MPENTVIGVVVGYGPGIIYVETETGKTIVLDRFAAIRRLPNGMTVFNLPTEQHTIKKVISMTNQSASKSFVNPSLRRFRDKKRQMQTTKSAYTNLLNATKSFLGQVEPIDDDQSFVNPDSVDDLRMAYQEAVRTLNNV